jgi:hypothetical protein
MQTSSKYRSFNTVLVRALEYVIMPPFLIVWHVGLDLAAR